MEETPHRDRVTFRRRAVISGFTLVALILTVSVMGLFRQTAQPVLLEVPPQAVVIATPPAIDTDTADKSDRDDEDTTAIDSATSESDTPSTESSHSATASPDVSKTGIQRLVGVWQQEVFGRRTLTIRPDGTASMVVEPNSIFSLGFGKRIDVELKFEVKANRAVYAIVGGAPADKVELAKKTWGDHWDEELLEVTESTFVLLEASGNRCVWERVTDKEAPKSPTE